MSQRHSGNFQVRGTFVEMDPYADETKKETVSGKSQYFKQKQTEKRG